jgi:hypothetical protein
MGGYLHFINHDILKPVSRDLVDIPNDIKVYQNHYKILKGSNLEGDIDKLKDKWTLNTYKKCTSPDNLPKIQQYVDYKYPCLTKDPQKVEAYKNTYLKSDNIAIKYPISENNNFNNKNFYSPQNSNSNKTNELINDLNIDIDNNSNRKYNSNSNLNNLRCENYNNINMANNLALSLEGQTNGNNNNNIYTNSNRHDNNIYNNNNNKTATINSLNSDNNTRN